MAENLANFAEDTNLQIQEPEQTQIGKLIHIKAYAINLKKITYKS